MPIKRNLLKVPIIATVGHRIIAAATEGIIMRNGRNILLGDTMLNIVTIIITGRIKDTNIITGRTKDTNIVITTIIIIQTVTAFGFFGGATRIGFKTSDRVREQGVLRIENGAYTIVREHFNSRDNAAIGR